MQQKGLQSHFGRTIPWLGYIDVTITLNLWKEIFPAVLEGKALIVGAPNDTVALNKEPSRWADIIGRRHPGPHSWLGERRWDIRRPISEISQAEPAKQRYRLFSRFFDWRFGW